MNATNLRPTIVPKSDQLNADDLIGRTITIEVTKVTLTGAEDQPVCIHFKGDNGKPYKPGKSMRRVLVEVWGEDGNAFVGRRMTLYRDERVQFGGYAVGGIRISHMSDISGEKTMALTTSRASRKPFTVHPLREQTPRQPGQFDPLTWAVTFQARLPDYDDVDPMRDDWNAHKAELKNVDPQRFREVNRAVADRASAIALADAGDDTDGEGKPHGVGSFGGGQETRQEAREAPGGATSPPPQTAPASDGPESGHSGDPKGQGSPSGLGLFSGADLAARQPQTAEPAPPPADETDDPLAWAAEVNADLEGMSLAEIDTLLADPKTQEMVEALTGQGMPGTVDALSRAIEERRRAQGWKPAG